MQIVKGMSDEYLAFRPCLMLRLCRAVESVLLHFPVNIVSTPGCVQTQLLRRDRTPTDVWRSLQVLQQTGEERIREMFEMPTIFLPFPASCHRASISGNVPLVNFNALVAHSRRLCVAAARPPHVS